MLMGGLVVAIAGTMAAVVLGKRAQHCATSNRPAGDDNPGGQDLLKALQDWTCGAKRFEAVTGETRGSAQGRQSRLTLLS